MLEAKDAYAIKVLLILLGIFIIVGLITTPHWQSYSESIAYLDETGELGTEGRILYYTNGGNYTERELRALEVLSDHYEIHINE